MGSWHLDRRTFLLGSGISMALPYMEAMGNQTAASDLPARMCAMYFPFGVGMPKEGSDLHKWRWFPNGEGKNFTFNESLKPLESVRESVTIIGGMSHPNGRRMGGHDTGDTFLTGALFDKTLLHNTVSVDQVAAAAVGSQTRYSSITMSTDGGVGEPTRSSTLSYDIKGRPIPAMNQPLMIFNRLFGLADEDLKRQQRRLRSASSMLDLVMEDSNSLRRRLGRHDQEKLDEYLSSVRQIEQRVRRTQRWLDIPLPSLTDEERSLLKLEADSEAPKEYMRTMYDLMWLAFKSDSTRVATYQIASMADASSVAGPFPFREGFKANLHTLAHGWNKPEGAVALGKWDKFMTEQLTYFLQRLKSTQEGDGTLLDRTMVLHGCSNSTTHNNNNYPLIFAGGNKLGLQHNHYVKVGSDVPMSNLFVTMLDKMGVQAPVFADSTGELNPIHA
ncbi:MAG: DUF1552 domain-containing protein [Planctomycetaceae bacterium]|jgi:hypothetical protein|nr:DUF1552 domain-containing protein [Planctomycetaceae bacterium]